MLLVFFPVLSFKPFSQDFFHKLDLVHWLCVAWLKQSLTRNYYSYIMMLGNFCKFIDIVNHTHTYTGIYLPKTENKMNIKKNYERTIDLVYLYTDADIHHYFEGAVRNNKVYKRTVNQLLGADMWRDVKYSHFIFMAVGVNGG